MFSNKEIDAKFNAIQERLDEIYMLMAESKRIVEASREHSAEDSPFKTKEGLYNYKHRKPAPIEDE